MWPRFITILWLIKVHNNNNNNNNNLFTRLCVGRNSAVGIATRCGLGNPGIESRWRFSAHVRTALGPNQPPVQWVSGLFPGDKAARAWQ
jgi:hypothetical protein